MPQGGTGFVSAAESTDASVTRRSPDGLTSQSWSGAPDTPDNDPTTTTTAPLASFGLNFTDHQLLPHVGDAPADGTSAWTDTRSTGDETNPAVQAQVLPIGLTGVTATWIASNTSAAGAEANNEQALYRVYLDDGETSPGIGVSVTLQGLAGWLATTGRTTYRIRCYANNDSATTFQPITIHAGDATGTVLHTITPAASGDGDFPTPITPPTGQSRGFADSPDTLDAGTITLTIPPRSGSVRGTLCAIRITATGTAASVPPGPNRVETTSRPDGTSTATTYFGGRPVSTAIMGSNGTTLETQSTLYDSLNRPFVNTRSRTGPTTTTYLSATCDAVKAITEENGANDRTTAFTYDSRGNRLTTKYADDSITTNRYNSRNQLEATWGSLAYATVYSYDYAGRMKTLGTSPTITSNAPVNGTGTVTFWQYDPTTALLTGKFYDNEGTNTADGPTYTHTHAGRLLTRTWKRGIVTSYYYDLGGQLRAVDYPNDSATPDVLQTRDRLGRPTISVQGTLAVAPGTLAVSNTGITMSEAATLRGTTNIYDPTDFHLATETTNLGGGFTRTFTRGVDAVGRLRTLAVGTDYTAAYGYDTAGRLQYVHPAATLPTTLAESDFTYGYLTNSYNLVQTVAGPAHAVTNTWEATRDVLATKINTTIATSNNIPSSFAYGVNAIGQRETLGPVLAGTTPVSTYTPKWTWDYNDWGELVSADHGADTTPDTLDRFYQYDDIGNRDYVRSGVFADLNGTLTDYSANALNQYTAIGSAAPAHDADGNLTEDRGVNEASQDRQYIWDAENRLICCEPN